MVCALNAKRPVPREFEEPVVRKGTRACAFQEALRVRTGVWIV